ncbi:MAG: anthranilate synthase component I family protein [Tepidisphaerales bacterium]
MSPVEPVEYVVAPSLHRPAVHLSADRRTLNELGDVLDALDFLAHDLANRPTQDGLPARWVGFLNYDLAHRFERLPHRAAEDTPLPLLVFGRCGVEAPAVPPSTGPDVLPAADCAAPGDALTAVASNFTRSGFEAAVARAIEYVHAGDVFQVNLAQRLTLPCPDPPATVYRRLLTHYPAWYGALLELPAWLPGCETVRAVVSNSPELFLHVDRGGTVTSRPIKGTRPRLPGMEQALRSSVKDQAELNMIVDLLRNDLGRVCRVGSVRVPEPRAIETHPTVYHGVSTITGQLKPDVGLGRLLAATFPCGSVTGAPKIRAMEIIDELEPHRRGVYCGSVGYVDARGEWQFNVAIRTMTLTSTHAHVFVGGGIVADSVPADEYEETLVKARAMLAAVRAGG